MLFGYGNHPIQAFPPEGPDQPFAERIRLRAAHRCFDDLKAHVRDRSIEPVEKIASWSCRINRYVWSEGIASRSCWRVQAAVGWAVTLR